MRGTSGYLELTPPRAIYPGTRHGWYVGLLVGTKFLRIFALFWSYQLLNSMHIVQFLFLTKLIVATFLLVIQKPFSTGKKLTKQQLIRIFQHGIGNAAISVLWLFGLTLAGPLRTILLYEHTPLVVGAALGAIFSHNGGPAKVRGAVVYIMAVITLLLFDSDGQGPSDISSHENDLVHYIISWTGVSDHKGGVVLLTLVLCLQRGFDAISRRLSVDVGGAKKLNAISTLATAMFLSPLAFFFRFTQESPEYSWLSFLLPLTMVALLLFVVDYYMDGICSQKLEPQSVSCWSFIPVAWAALFITCVRSPTLVSVSADWQGEHKVSGGVVVSCALMTCATLILSSPSRPGSKGNFIGYSKTGSPLYCSPGDASHASSTSALQIIRNSVKQICEDSDSRKIFYFLCLNFAFTFVELLYGVWTNSLGLISDGFHMLFDCSALIMGLCAAVMAKWKATPTFSFGYSRIDSLSGFVNGLFLIVISLFVCTEALGRLFDPPDIITERLLLVSVIGLFVNLIGVLTFRHSHSGSSVHSHSSSSTHSHSGSSPHIHHGHSHTHGHSHSSSNMHGVFLHIVADTLGSLGVILSSLMIENFGWLIADPICSVFISVLIFVSVLPLLRDSMQILLLRVPVVLEKPVADAVRRILTLEGVVSCRNLHVWQHSSDTSAVTIHLHVSLDNNEQKTVSQVTAIFREIGLHFITVQVEKDEFYHHLLGLSSRADVLRKGIHAVKHLDGICSIDTMVKAV